MSTLTKVLIVVLSLASIFLCAIVVTYVSTATNYREAYDNLQQSYDALKQREASVLSKMRQEEAKTQSLIDDLRNQNQQLDTEIDNLQTELKVARTNAAALQETINGWAAVVKGFEQTIEDMGTSLSQARNELDRVREKHLEERQRLNEITASLDARIVELQALEKERRRLLEEKTALEERLERLATRAAAPVEAVEPVTAAMREKAVAVEPLPLRAELEGVITEVDLENSLASIDIGSADGVELGMKFYITRSDTFVCNLLITDVEPEEAAGVLELVQQRPKAGDTASTQEPAA